MILDGWDEVYVYIRYDRLKALLLKIVFLSREWYVWITVTQRLALDGLEFGESRSTAGEEDQNGSYS